ncbi:hypothetical protein SAMN05192558_102191 [Actinokineospora alba]|uniref:PH domain-containing protein n=1 Tax=Actinokineospora alba TaxID=504798 RepID=A0A1H0HNW6_9PSEU|nr:hypothetical protein [Actinokineospora alba]TDP64815.1 hypothetical protein C8E96_0287 [Actinokineospora alba]SDH46601.1 hypothetical protein SAMN05421871_101112 [Actinokineospora alba]SDO20784.1 hypothetical protein SAMN05192558_102191 [Actinokineospora alba]
MDDRSLPCPRPWRAADGSPQPSGTPTGAATAATFDGVPGLLIPARQARVAAGVVLIIVGLGLGGLSALLIIRGGVGPTLGAVVLGILGVLLLLAGFFALKRKQRMVGILLTPDHVALTWVHPVVRLPWHDITEIRPLSLRIGRSKTAPTQNYLGLITTDAAAADTRMRKVAAKFGRDVACAVPMRTMDIDQLVVLHSLRFYLENPDARAELSGDDAVRRVREGRF